MARLAEMGYTDHAASGAALMRAYREDSQRDDAAMVSRAVELLLKSEPMQNLR